MDIKRQIYSVVVKFLKRFFSIVFSTIKTVLKKTFWFWLIWHYQRIFLNRNFADLKFTYALKTMLVVIQLVLFSQLYLVSNSDSRDLVITISIGYFYIHKLSFFSYSSRIYLVIKNLYNL